MDIKVELDYYTKWHSEALHFIKTMLLYDRVRIEEVPQLLRISENSIYVTAFRVANGISCSRFIDTMKLLCNDIHSIDSRTEEYQNLSKLLSHYIELNNYTEEEQFVNFKKNIYPKILCEM